MRVHVMFSVDWEGTSLLEENVKAMASLARDFPCIPRVQFINPVYFVDSAVTQFLNPGETIRKALGPNDECGLHIHCWKRLIDAVGLPFRSSPAFFNGGESIPWLGEVGGDVPLSQYTTEEVSQILRWSLDLLRERGFSDIHSFRAGGWAASDTVYAALLENGIARDSSPVPAHLVAQKYGDTYLHQLVLRQWKGESETSQPRVHQLGPGSIQVFPNNACLVDYVGARQAQVIFEKVVKHSIAHNSEGYFHFGWHQETLVRAHRRKANDEFAMEQTGYLQQIQELMGYLHKRKGMGDIDINFTTMRDFSSFDSL